MALLPRLSASPNLWSTLDFHSRIEGRRVSSFSRYSTTRFRSSKLASSEGGSKVLEGAVEAEAEVEEKEEEEEEEEEEEVEIGFAL